MHSTDFLHRNYDALKALVEISVGPGKRPDYVQGGGGNTSAKLLGGMMAIKASGYRLSEVTLNDGYAVLDSDKLRNFYAERLPESLQDVEADGVNAANAALAEIDGLPRLRPSIEAGMHSVLDTYVLHTHPVYANLAACSGRAEELLRDALTGWEHAYGFLPYQTPGALLTFAVKKQCERVEAEQGKRPTALLLENHGLVVTHSDPLECVRIHAEVNTRIAALLGVDEKQYPAVAIAAEGDHYISRSPWLQDILKGSEYTEAFFGKEALYPDQLVFLDGKVKVDAKDRRAECVISRDTGRVVYHCSYKQAYAIEEALCAVLFITRTLKRNGIPVQTMDAAAKHFIANMETEKYRQSVGK